MSESLREMERREKNEALGFDPYARIAVLEAAIAEAEARGRRQGLEEAAKVAEVHSYAPGTETFVVNGQTLKSRNGEDQFVGVGVLRAGIRSLAASLRSLATAPAETHKPETVRP